MGIMDILPLGLSAITGIGDTISMFGANLANQGLIDEARNLNRDFSAWGHNQLGANNWRQNVGAQNMLYNAQNFFYGGTGANTAYMPGNTGLSYGDPNRSALVSVPGDPKRYLKGTPTRTGDGTGGTPGGGSSAQVANMMAEAGALVGGGRAGKAMAGRDIVPDSSGAGQAPGEGQAQGGGGPAGTFGGGGGLLGQYEALRGRVMSEYEGYGNQQRRDINEQFNTLQSQQRGEMTNRGMASSTLLGGMRRGTERRRADALGGLEERLTMGKINLDQSMTGQLLSQQQNAFNVTQGYGQNALNIDDRGNMRTFDFGRETQNQMMNLLGGINHQYMPTPLGLSQGLGSAGVGAPSYPTDYSGYIQGGSTLAGLLGGAAILASDEKIKRDFAEIDEASILDKVEALPVSEWAYKEHPESRHIGPMAQDFAAAFKLGTDDRYINTVDAIGVLLASVKALRQEVKDLRDQLSQKG